MTRVSIFHDTCDEIYLRYIHLVVPESYILNSPCSFVISNSVHDLSTAIFHPFLTIAAFVKDDL